MIKPYQHQIDKAEECWKILKSKGYVYLAGKPRSGKTLTSLLIAEHSDKINSVLILTKKQAIAGWEKFLNDVELKHSYKVTNYEQAGKWDATKRKPIFKLNKADYDLVIIDESHNLGTVGKPSGRFKVIKSLCYDMPHIHLSGTAIVESPNSIYHQMAISKYNPFRFKNFYDFFRKYGEPYYIKAAGRDIAQYDRFKPELLDAINEFTVYVDTPISLYLKPKYNKILTEVKNKGIYKYHNVTFTIANGSLPEFEEQLRNNKIERKYYEIN